MSKRKQKTLVGLFGPVLLAAALSALPPLSGDTAWAQGNSGNGGGSSNGNGGGQGNSNGNGQGQDRGGSGGMGRGNADGPAKGTKSVGGTVTHPNGMEESITNGRYEMRDAQGRVIVNRDATLFDVLRIGR